MKKSYHFDIGNSFDGPIGFCARVAAHSEEEALELLRAAMQQCCEGVMVFDDSDDQGLLDAYDADTPPGIEYLQIYMNGRKVTVADIDEVNTYDGIDDDGDEEVPDGEEN